MRPISNSPTRSRRAVRATRPGGFTLIETSLATLIVGIGVLAMVDAQTAFIVSNQWSSHAASATFLANEIRELTRARRRRRLRARRNHRRDRRRSRRA